MQRSLRQEDFSFLKTMHKYIFRVSHKRNEFYSSILLALS